MIIVLIGLPGSGKGTQGGLLAKKLNLPYISVGDMLRVMARTNDEDGLLLNDCMEQGKLAPLTLVNRAVKRFLLLDEYKNGCVLDGYPRSLGQAQFLEKIVKQNIKVIYFDIDDQIIIKRIKGRFNCQDCGEIYNSYSIKPKIDNICDICGADRFLYRKDDSVQVITRRIEEYKTETIPLISYYQLQAEVYTVDASKNKYEVELALNKILKMI